MNFSFANLQASNLATGLIARVNTQIQQAAAFDEQAEVDQAPGQKGEVLLDQPDSFVQLSYDAAEGSPKTFAFKANQNLAAEDGTVIVPSGTETSYAAAGGNETFGLQVPTETGMVKQEAVLNNEAGMLLFSDGTSSQEIPFATLSAAQATSALVQKLQLQISQTLAADEQAGTDMAMGKPGQVQMQDAGSAVNLTVENDVPQSFSFKATQNLAAPDGTIVVAAGTETGYLRNGDTETFSQTIPTDQGMVRQEVVLDNAKQAVDFQEYILKP